VARYFPLDQDTAAVAPVPVADIAAARERRRAAVAELYGAAD
jgi:hypothetical protein